MSTHRSPPTPPSSPKPGHSSSPLVTTAGVGGELHQTQSQAGRTLTTNEGAPIADDQNSLRAGARGPTLLEDFVLREKLTHFDHERIPERIVHARGSGAHGTFRPHRSWSKLTRASFLSDPKRETPVFVRFSTVAGGAGSVDLPRDVRGFAVKFYTDEGNFDIVGNNIPVFFIQDAMKFPDLVHSVKMEPDRGFPQAGSAHDTFWDFVSLMPESTHMLMWAMSDRALPRSLRMMEGFGVHTFRFVNAAEQSTFVKFHWRPSLGAQSVLWDEATKINGADNDFHRRDLWGAIDQGKFPSWELSVQAFDEKLADTLRFDILDATKLIPEEVVPLTPLGTMVLNRNPDNFFAETEQVAFHPGNLVPGVDVTNDPLLQGRLASYVDTQLSRLGGPNFHEIPINQAKGCPFPHRLNNLRDGHMQMDVPKGRVAYEPSTLDPTGPRENPHAGYVTHPHSHSSDDARRVRVRSESFSDHYSQARMFFRSMSEPEKRHIIAAFAFELGNVQTLAIRARMLGHLAIVDSALVGAIEERLGMKGARDAISPATPPVDLPVSPSLSLVLKAKPTLAGREVGVLIGEGFNGALCSSLLAALAEEGAHVQVLAARIGGAVDDKGNVCAADCALGGAPSVLFDAVAVLASRAGAVALSKDPAAVDFVRDAFRHLKAIGHSEAALVLLKENGVEPDGAVVSLEAADGQAAFIAAARQGKRWAREVG